MALTAIIVASLATFFAFITILMNVGLLYGLFVSKKLKKSPSLTLFYVRFLIDAVFCVGNLIMLFFTFLNLTNMDSILDSHPNFIFYVSWPTVNLMNIRAFLVIIITFDRTFAVFFPVYYHNYRDKIGNSILITVVFGYSIVENMVLWVICEFVLAVPVGCINMGCYMNKCFIQFYLSYEMISHVIIFLVSLLLVVKIFIWNNCTTSSKSKDLTRANLLALLDTFIIFAFDIIPAYLLAKYQSAKFEDVGPVMAVSKMSGFVIEGYLVVRALKRKQDMEAESRSFSTVKVKASTVK